MRRTGRYFENSKHPHNSMVRRDSHLGKESLLWVEGELTLPSICDDLFAGSSLLWSYLLANSHKRGLPLSALGSKAVT